MQAPDRVREDEGVQGVQGVVLPGEGVGIQAVAMHPKKKGRLESLKSE